MTAVPLLDTLSDDQLLAETKRLVADEREATAALLRALMELDARRLYLREGCASLFTYCTQVLHLAEGAAYDRIEAARAARRYPAVLAGFADGSLTLTSIRLLAPHFTEDNHRELLAAARHKSKRELEVVIATLRPKPPVPTVIRKLPDRPASAPQTRDARGDGPAPPRALGNTPRPLVPERAEALRCAGPRSDTTEVRVEVTAPPPAPAISRLAPDRYKLQVTISHETHGKLRPRVFSCDARPTTSTRRHCSLATAPTVCARRTGHSSQAVEDGSRRGSETVLRPACREVGGTVAVVRRGLANTLVQIQRHDSVLEPADIHDIDLVSGWLTQVE